MVPALKMEGGFRVVLLATLAAAGCAPAVESPLVDSSSYRAQIESWRAERDLGLRKDDGWLTLVGLYWLEEGETSFGSAVDNDLEFPAGKIDERAGVFFREGDAVTLIPAAGVTLSVDGEPISEPIPLVLDTSDDGPTLVESGTLSFFAIERGEAIGIRLKDRESPVLAGFEGMDYFPPDPAWRLTGRYELFAEPRTLRIPNVLGTVTEEEILGQVTFEVAGEVLTLQPSGDAGEGFFLVFGDQTNGMETYGGGRFVYAEPVAADGSVVIDFNKAYCPPCVFTPYATCPLPPAENKLPIRVEAGEKMFGAPH